MKKIGLLGGLGPESTIDYYKEIIASFSAAQSELDYPEIFIYSANPHEFIEFMNKKQWREMTEWLLEKILTIHQAGAEFAAIASNTPHIVFEEIEAKSPIPLLSIVESTCAQARDIGVKKVGLMGSKLTMETDFYKKPFISNGIPVIVPSETDQQLIHNKLFSEIELGILKDATREKLFAIAKKMADENGIDALILGCTELPLILTEERYGIPFLNTTAIHCERIVKYCIEK